MDLNSISAEIDVSRTKAWRIGAKPVQHFYSVDLLIEQDNRLHPVEIKKNASPGTAAAKGFAELKLQGRDIGPSAVIRLRESSVALDHDVIAIPAAYL